MVISYNHILFVLLFRILSVSLVNNRHLKFKKTDIIICLIINRLLGSTIGNYKGLDGHRLFIYGRYSY